MSSGVAYFDGRFAIDTPMAEMEEAFRRLTHARRILQRSAENALAGWRTAPQLFRGRFAEAADDSLDEELFTADRWDFALESATSELAMATADAGTLPVRSSIAVAGKVALVLAALVGGLALVPSQTRTLLPSALELQLAEAQRAGAWRMHLVGSGNDALPFLLSMPAVPMLPSASPDPLLAANAKPLDLCNAFAAAGFSNTGWQKSELFAREWECFSLSSPPNGASSDSSIFLSVKGKDEASVDVIRIKMTIPADHDSAGLKTMLAPLIAAIETHGGFRLEARAADVFDVKPFASFEGGQRLRFFREYGDGGHYNLILSRR